LATEYIYI